MIKKTITFFDFDDNQVVEDHYFHLSMKELTELEVGQEVGMYDRLQIMLENGNGAQIMQEFEQLIRMSYGERVDGSASKFHKNPERAEEFMTSLAYDALLSDLLTNPQSCANFIIGVVPRDLANTDQMKEAVATIQAGENAASAIAVREVKDVDVSVDQYAEGAVFTDADSGLKNPRDDKGNFVPWALRHATPREQIHMSHGQLIDIMQRQAQGWVPPMPVAPATEPPEA